MKRLFGIRGAVCAENTAASIGRATVRLCSRLLEENRLSAEDIVAMHFTLTRDLDACNPCAAFRRDYRQMNTAGIALFCSQEAFVQGGLPKVVRLLVTAYLEEGSSLRHVYLDGAEVLRPDFGTPPSAECTS